MERIIELLVNIDGVEVWRLFDKAMTYELDFGEKKKEQN